MCVTRWPGQNVGRHLPDDPEGQAAEDALVLGPQLYQSFYNPLPPDVWVALCQLCHQGIEAAHGAIVLGHTDSLCCGGDADHLPVLYAGAKRRLTYQLERGQRKDFS